MPCWPRNKKTLIPFCCCCCCCCWEGPTKTAVCCPWWGRHTSSLLHPGRQDGAMCNSVLDLSGSTGDISENATTKTADVQGPPSTPACAGSNGALWVSRWINARSRPVLCTIALVGEACSGAMCYRNQCFENPATLGKGGEASWLLLPGQVALESARFISHFCWFQPPAYQSRQCQPLPPAITHSNIEWKVIGGTHSQSSSIGSLQEVLGDAYEPDCVT